MELKVDLPALAGKDIDPAAFQRVWNRVMPDQSLSPIEMDTIEPLPPEQLSRWSGLPVIIPICSFFSL